MKTKILAILALGALGLSAAPAAAGPLPVVSLERDAAALGGVTQVYHRGRAHYRHYPPRVRVYPRYREQVPYFADYSNYYPAVRGFEDRNPVPRGNMRGCTVDLGYGRYESCDKN